VNLFRISDFACPAAAALRRRALRIWRRGAKAGISGRLFHLFPSQFHAPRRRLGLQVRDRTCDFVFREITGLTLTFEQSGGTTRAMWAPIRKRYGFQLTFFRTQIAEPGSEKTWPKNPSAWRTKDIFLAHTACRTWRRNGFT